MAANWQRVAATVPAMFQDTPERIDTVMDRRLAESRRTSHPPWTRPCPGSNARESDRDACLHAGEDRTIRAGPDASALDHCAGECAHPSRPAPVSFHVRPRQRVDNRVQGCCGQHSSLPSWITCLCPSPWHRSNPVQRRRYAVSVSSQTPGAPRVAVRRIPAVHTGFARPCTSTTARATALALASEPALPSR